MTEMMSGVEHAEDPKPEAGLDGLDDQLIDQFVGRDRPGRLRLTGEGGVLQGSLDDRGLFAGPDGWTSR